MVCFIFVILPSKTKLITSHRLVNILPRMAYRQPKSRHKQLHVYMGVSLLFQCALGRVPDI